MSPHNGLLGVFAPYPRREYCSDGWYRRIKIIDSIFEGIPRVYFNTIHQAPKADPIVSFRNGVREVFISPNSKRYHRKVLELLEKVSLGYIHTTHIGEDFIKLSFPIPFIIDFHGAAPEEESMQGNSEKSDILGNVEKTLYSDSLLKVYVSPGMQAHFENKYSKSLAALELPIISDVRLNEFTLSDALNRSSKNSFVYSGGLQKWQNIAEMMQFAESLGKPLTIATNQIAEFEKNYKKSSSTFLRVGTFARQELLDLYADSSFGYVLRDDNIVNSVAFPTKLFEYIASGIIPVVKYENLGGLSDLGMFSLNPNQLINNDMSVEELAKKRLSNFEISRNVVENFLRAATTLRSTVVSTIFN